MPSSPVSERKSSSVSNNVTPLPTHPVDNIDGCVLMEDEALDGGKLYRKVDLRIMPFLFLCYFLQFLDKVSCCCISRSNR